MTSTGFPSDSLGKESAWDAGDPGSIPEGRGGGQDFLEKRMATHSSILAWRILEGSLAGYYCPWSCKELAQEMTLTSTLTLKQHRFEMHRSMSWSGPHCLWLAESVDGKLQVLRDEFKVIHGFSVSWRVGAPNLHIVQGSAIILRRL